MNGVDLVSTTSEVGFVTDRAGVIRGWNTAAAERFDRPARAVVGRACWEVLQGRDAYGNDYCCASCPLRVMAFSGRHVHRCELYFRDASDTFTPYSVITLLLRGAPPVNPALVHLLQPARWDRRQVEEGPAAVSGNRSRGELTTREEEVLAQLARGRSTEEISVELRISPKTVGNHIQSILHKLRAHSRLQAVAVARQAGLL